MKSKSYLGWGAVFLAVVMAVAEYLGSPSSLTYLWALVVLAWGALTLKTK